MALTRLDCDIFRGGHAIADASSYVAINPMRRPGQLVFAGSTAVIQGVGSQVAYRLALDHFTRGVLESYERSRPQTSGGEDDVAVEVLEEAFRAANSSVYSFGHKLSAGGRMAASLLGLTIEGVRFAAGRVGQGSVYLFRGNELFPLFSAEGVDRAVVGDVAEFSSDLATQRQGFVGSHSIIDVEVASVSLQPGDVVAAFSRPLTSLNETLLFQHLEVTLDDGFPESQPPRQAEQMCVDVFTEPDTLSFACITTVGPDVIFCSRALA